MIEPRELISATRQLGSMTEAGVDILRAIKVLRAQTHNAELVALYDRLAHELRLGSGLADAMSHAPQAFSEFAVSIVREGEARGDLATSFYRIADYLQKEREADAPLPEPAQVATQNPPEALSRQCPVWLRLAVFKTMVALGGLFAALFVVELVVALGMIAPRWHLPAAILVITIFLLGAAWRLRHTKDVAEIVHTAEGQPQSRESTFNTSSEATFE